jgi:hypothetical protein
MKASCGGGQSPPWAVAPVGRKEVLNTRNELLEC